MQQTLMNFMSLTFLTKKQIALFTLININVINLVFVEKMFKLKVQGKLFYLYIKYLFVCKN